jgi:hypothetical protein
MKFSTQTVAVALLTLPTFALAWGREGHQIVAAIAESRLTEKTQAEVRRILEGDSMSAVSVWSDVVRPQRRETAPWHYVNIHINEDVMDPNNCPGGDCVTTIISDLEALLRRADTLSDLERQEALKHLIHFIGDQSQPLHNANEDDLGGNTKTVAWYGRNMNLHSVWDTGIIRRERDIRSITVDDLCRELNAEIRPEQIRLWIQGTPVDWTNESHRVAIEFAYPGWSPEPDELYFRKSIGAVRVQLQKGGIRLAHVLNRVYDRDYRGELLINRPIEISENTAFTESAAFQQLLQAEEK